MPRRIDRKRVTSGTTPSPQWDGLNTMSKTDLGTVRRLRLVVYQAESFDRDRSVPVTNKKHQFAIQERLIAYTIVLL